MTSLFLSSMAQNSTITLSGIVLDNDEVKPLANSNIYIKNKNLGVVSSSTGLFSLNVDILDTVVFSTVGYKTMYYIIPDTLSSTSYSVIQKIPRDTISLNPVEINSWPSLQHFNEAFTKEFGFDSDIKTAEKNALVVPRDIDPSKDIDSKDAYQYIGNRYTNVYVNSHIPLNNLLNPKRWDKLVNDWKKGQHR